MGSVPAQGGTAQRARCGQSGKMEQVARGRFERNLVGSPGNDLQPAVKGGDDMCEVMAVLQNEAGRRHD